MSGSLNSLDDMMIHHAEVYILFPGKCVHVYNNQAVCKLPQ